MQTGTTSWRINEDFLAEPSALLHSLWATSHSQNLNELHGLQVLPVSILFSAPENWIGPEPASIPAASRDWAGHQKMRYPVALRFSDGHRVTNRVGSECLGDDGEFSYGVILIEEPWSLRLGPDHFISAGLRLDALAYEEWLRKAILDRN